MGFLRNTIKACLPTALRRKLHYRYKHTWLIPYQRILDTAPAHPEWLPAEALPALHGSYPPLPNAYAYTPEVTRVRGSERARDLLGLLPKSVDPPSRFLELGCHDGMMAAALHESGKTVIGLDRNRRAFDSRAREAGVRLIHADAAALPLPDASCDVVYGHNCFEHFPDPERVLNESMRVLRTGGFLYTAFAPAYYSAYGEHAYLSIHVPFCHILFPTEVLNEFASSISAPSIDPNHVNRWSRARYRDLWKRTAAYYKPIFYYEYLNTAHLDLLAKYPTCFKSKHADVLEFATSGFELLFQKSR
ncbi:MAG: hypothetical protein AMXMBFR7_52900 [Planctomycetota bacterium]